MLSLAASIYVPAYGSGPEGTATVTCWNYWMLLDILNLSGMHIGYSLNLSGMHTNLGGMHTIQRKRTHPTPLSFKTKKFTAYALWIDTLAGSKFFDATRHVEHRRSLCCCCSTNHRIGTWIGEGEVRCE